MAPEIELHRAIKHPWSGDGCWDQMLITATAVVRLDAIVAAAEAKFWRLFLRDPKKATAVMYKPCGATAAWSDGVDRKGADNALARALEVGDRVITDWTGVITLHVVTERAEKAACGSGVVLRVAPAVPGSRSYHGDLGSGSSAGANPWLDAAWFRKAP